MDFLIGIIIASLTNVVLSESLVAVVPRRDWNWENYNPAIIPPGAVTIKYCSRDFYCSYMREQPACSCHRACFIFGNCCYNRKGYAPPEYLLGVTKYRHYFQCIEDRISNKRYQMVSKCPESWKGLNRCNTNGNDTDNTVGGFEDISKIPVLDRIGITYRNLYCAFCHGVDMAEISAWSLSAEDCNRTVAFGNFSSLSFNDRVGYLTKHCYGVRFLPPIEHPYHSVSSILCPKETGDVIDSCANASSNLTTKRRCADIAAPIDFLGRKFKNIYCLYCNNVDQDFVVMEDRGSCLYLFPEGVSCDSIDAPHEYCWGPWVVPITIAFDFRGQTGHNLLRSKDQVVEVSPAMCTEGQIFDPFLRRCKELTCQDGYIFQGATCERLPMINNTCDQVQVDTVVERVNYTLNDCLEEFMKLSQCFSEQLQLLTRFHFNYIDFTCNSTNSVEWYQFRSTNATARAIIQSLFEVDTKATPQSFPGFCESLKFINITAQCIPYGFEGRDMICDSPWALLAENNTHGINFTDSGKAVDITQLRIRHMLTFPSSQRDATMYTRKFVKRCDYGETNSSSCASLTYNSSLFVPLDNLSDILVFALNTSFQFSSDEYKLLSTGEIEICNFLPLNGSINDNNVSTFLPQYSFAQQIISTIGISLSIICLSLTLLTYCVFPSLRSVIAGVLIMTCCASLILAQLFLLFAGIATRNPTICSIISASGHFFWLTAFSTSSVLGYDMSRTFSVRNQTMRGTGVTTWSLIYFLPSVGVPSAISGVLLCLYMIDDAGDVFGITYGSSSACWIGGPLVHLYAFGIPVAVSLLVNVAFFLHITVSIIIQKGRGKRIRKSCDTCPSRDLLIYVKIFVILGLTWISGFLAALIDQPWLWYMFIIFTSLQGVFIFLSLTVKSTIWRMWGSQMGLTNSDVSGSANIRRQKRSGTAASKV